MANFGKAEISLLFKPAASVPLLKILNVQKVRLRFIRAEGLIPAVLGNALRRNKGY